MGGGRGGLRRGARGGRWGGQNLTGVDMGWTWGGHGVDKGWTWGGGWGMAIGVARLSRLLIVGNQHLEI